LAITFDGKFLGIGSEKGSIAIYDLDAKQIVHQFTSNSIKNGKEETSKHSNKLDVDAVCSLTSFQERFFVAAYIKGSIKIFDLKTKALVHHIPQAHAGINKIIPKLMYFRCCSRSFGYQ